LQEAKRSQVIGKWNKILH